MKFLENNIEKICKIPSITGFEDELREEIINLTKNNIDEVISDKLGNLILHKKGYGKDKL